MIELTPRQLKIAYLISKGYRNSDIAEELNLHIRTIKFNIARIMDKLGLEGRVRVARWYWENYEKGPK